MRFFNKIFLIAALALILAATFVSAVSAPEAGLMERQDEPVSSPDGGLIERRENSLLEARDDDFELDKRSCTYNGCKCNTNYKAGLYCGWCNGVKSYGWSVDGYGPGDTVYQCAGASGECCSYGYRKSCRAGTGPCWG